MGSISDDDAWIEAVENSPEFIASQLRAGEVLTEAHVAAIQSLLSTLDARENVEVEAFHSGRIAGFREVGGDELVVAVEMKDHERIAKMVRATMDRIFPKEQRTRQ